MFTSNLQLDLVPQEINPGHGTKIARGLDGYTDIGYCSSGLLTDIPLTGATRVNPGHGTKIARGLDWYKSDQHESMLIKFTCRYSSTGAAKINPGHGTKNCKRCPSTSLYEFRFV